jgi:hypothetical protein
MELLGNTHVLSFCSLFFLGISTVVQVESLRLVASLSERSDLDGNFHCQLLLGLPSFFIPLSHEDKVYYYFITKQYLLNTIFFCFGR